MKRIVLLLLGLLLALPQFAQERILLFMSRERLCLKNFRLLQKILFF